MPRATVHQGPRSKLSLALSAARRLSASAVLFALSAGCASPAGAPPQTLLITNARVYTGDAAQPWAEAIAVQGERIVFVGARDDATHLARVARTVDLSGALVLPGLIDSHTHPGTASEVITSSEQTNSQVYANASLQD